MFPFVSKGCRKNRHIEIETDIYDFVFAKRLAITEGESTFHMNKKYLKYTIKNYYKKPIYVIREMKAF